MGLFKIIKIVVYVGAFIAAIPFIPGIPPDATFSEYSIILPKQLTGKIGVINERLSGAEVLFKGKLRGAEDFASYNGELYTGVSGGYIMKITEDKLVPVVKLGKKCGAIKDSTCGKPLGLKFDKKGALYVCDASNGLYKIDVKTGKYEQLVGHEEVIQGKKPMIFNSMDIASNGDIYWSTSSTDAIIDDITITVFANPSGRLYRYNVATKKNEVLVDNLGFGNGVALSADESFVIVMECLTSRITRYNLKGPRAGKQETFAEGLPGLPDNIHSDGKNGFLLTLYRYADSQNPLVFQTLASKPYVRKLLARLVALYKAPFKFLKEYYPDYAEVAYPYFPGAQDPFFVPDQKIKCVLRLDDKGKIIDAAYSTSDKVVDLSSAYIHDGYLWLGSPWADQILRVPLSQAFPSL